jgi:hypothetical protein
MGARYRFGAYRDCAVDMSGWLAENPGVPGQFLAHLLPE